MTLLLDAGALVAVERMRADVVALINAELVSGRRPVTHGRVVGQVWRGGIGRQARFAWLWAGVDVTPLDDELGRRAGVLLARSGRNDGHRCCGGRPGSGRRQDRHF